MKKFSRLFCAVVLLGIVNGNSAFAKSITLKQSEWETSFNKSGNLRNVTFSGKKIISRGAFIFCFPIDKSGKRQRIFQYASNSNNSVNKTKTFQKTDGDKKTITSHGFISKKDCFNNSDILKYTSTVVVSPKGMIQIKYELEFLQTLKWKTFWISTVFSPLVNDVKFKENTKDGKGFDGNFPKNFKKGEVQSLELELPDLGKLYFAASPGTFWEVSDSRTYGGSSIYLNLTPSWFTKGGIIEKGRKETVEINIQLPVKGANPLDTFVPVSPASPVNNKDISTEKKTKQKASVSSPGPGKLIPVMDKFSKGQNHVNPLFLKNMPEQKWWNARWNQRIPLVVGETIKKKRTSIPITLERQFPKEVAQNSIRVVTTGTKVIPSQVELLDKEKNIFRITFPVTLAEKESLPIFVYYDNKSAKKPKYDTILKQKENDTAYTIYNRRILVEFYKAPRADGAIIRKLELLNSDGRNRIRNFMDTSGGFKISKRGSKEKRILAKGSLPKWEVTTSGGDLFKKIKYSTKNISIEFIIFENSDAIYYKITGAKDTLTCDTKCLPMGDELHDSAYYETDLGVKKIPLSGLGYNRAKFDLNKYLKEGWVCIGDDRGEVLGQIFDTANTKVSIFQAEDANSITLSEKISPQGTKGAVILATGSFAKIRERYIDWKNPPELIVGSPQGRKEYSKITSGREAKKKFVNNLYTLDLGCYPFTKNNIDAILDNIVNTAVKKNVNCIDVRLSSRNFYVSWPSKTFHNKAPHNCVLGKLVKLAHKKNIEVAVTFLLYKVTKWNIKRLMLARKNIPDGVPWGCAIGDKKFLTDLSRELAATGIDKMEILDEYRNQVNSKIYKQEFKKRYGMEVPKKLIYKNLRKPEYHNKVFYDMNIVTELVEAMSKAAKSVNPKIKIFHTSSPSNNLRSLTDGYHDLEMQSDFVDYIYTDPYTTNLDSLKYTCKLCRAALDNKALLHSYVGWSHYLESESDPDFYRRQTLLHILSGVNEYKFAGASMSDEELPEVANAMRKTAAVLSYTGLGDLIAASTPIKFIGVFRDRNAFIDSIKEGECNAKYSLTDYDKRVDKVIRMQNVPTDIIFSKYFNLKTLSQYPIIVIPSDRVLKDEYAKAAQEYVKQGGILIVQGESIKNKIIGNLCEVVLTGQSSGMIKLKGIDNPLKNKSKSFTDECVVIKAKGKILAKSQDNKPLITYSKYGKGKVIFIAAINSWPFLKDIIKFETKTLPLELSEKLCSNVFVAGDSYIIGIYNPNYQKTFSGRIKFNLPLKDKKQVRDVMMGKILPIVNGGINIKVPPEGINYYIVSSGQNGKGSAFTLARQNSTPTYSDTSGMKFLRQKEKFKSLTATARAPKDSRFLYIGVYNGGNRDKITGWQGIKNSFKEYSKYVKVDYISKLDANTLNYYDAVIVPVIKSSKSINKDWKECLRKYVENGGGVFLVHNSIGPRGGINVPLFPEIGKIIGNSLHKNFKIKTDNLITQGKELKKHCGWDVMNPGLDVLFQKAELKTGTAYEIAYVDHLEIEPGASGNVLAMDIDENGNMHKPVLVAGKLGKGKVVLCGMLVGATHKKGTEWDAEEKVPEKGEFGVLINSVFWLAKK